MPKVVIESDNITLINDLVILACKVKEAVEDGPYTEVVISKDGVESGPLWITNHQASTLKVTKIA